MFHIILNDTCFVYVRQVITNSSETKEEAKSHIHAAVHMYT